MAQSAERCDSLPVEGDGSACSSRARAFFLFLFPFFSFQTSLLLLSKLMILLIEGHFKVSTADFSSANSASKVEWAHALRLVLAGFHWRRSWSRMSTSDLVKIGVVNEVTSSTESELEESEWFHFLLIPLMTPTLVI